MGGGTGDHGAERLAPGLVVERSGAHVQSFGLPSPAPGGRDVYSGEVKAQTGICPLGGEG